MQLGVRVTGCRARQTPIAVKGHAANRSDVGPFLRARSLAIPPGAFRDLPEYSCSLVSGLVLTHEIGANTPALGDLETVLLRPGAHRGTVNPRPARPDLAAATPASGYPPAGLDIRGKVPCQPGAIIRAQIDLVRHAVQAECDGLGILRSVEVIGDNDCNTPRHKAHSPGISGRCQNSARTAHKEPVNRLQPVRAADSVTRAKAALGTAKADKADRSDGRTPAAAARAATIGAPRMAAIRRRLRNSLSLVS
jgi:hypothetical protein